MDEAEQQGVQGRVRQFVGNLMPGPGADHRNAGRPLSVPVHVFKDQLKPFDGDPARHGQYVTTVQSDANGQYRVALPPGRYTLVAEIDGALYLNQYTTGGFWSTVVVNAGHWARWNIDDTSKAAF